jgi:hypothetical protein
VSPEQRRLARHALGLPNDMRRSYRNRFYAIAGHSEWGAMVTAGLAEASEAAHGMQWFGLTRAGAAVALDRGETLCPEDFPPATAREANADTGHRDRSDDHLRDEKQPSSNTQKNTMGGEHGSS